MPDFQEYHALRGVRDAKVFRDGLPHHPDDSVTSVNHERNRIPLIPRHFPVDQEILQFPLPRRPEWVKPIPGRRLRMARGNSRAPAATPTSDPRAAHFL